MNHDIVRIKPDGIVTTLIGPLFNEEAPKYSDITTAEDLNAVANKILETAEFDGELVVQTADSNDNVEQSITINTDNPGLAA